MRQSSLRSTETSASLGWASSKRRHGRVPLGRLRRALVLTGRLALAVAAMVSWVEPGHALDPAAVRSDLAPKPAAPARDPEAQFALARRYEHAEGVTRDYAQAVALYCRAAEQGHGGAAHNLAWMYLNGRGVVRNDDTAATWLKIAAENGSRVSANLLARMPSANTDADRGCPEAKGKWHQQSAEKLDRLVPEPIRVVVERWAQEFDLDPYLVLAVITVESAFDSKAVSAKSAQGLMQLIPETAGRFGVGDAFDPSENVRGGSQYLRWLLDHFDGDLRLALAGYNAGEGAIATHGGVPPYRETIGYLEKIRQIYAHPDLEGAEVEAPSLGPQRTSQDTLALFAVALRNAEFLPSE